MQYYLLNSSNLFYMLVNLNINQKIYKKQQKLGTKDLLLGQQCILRTTTLFAFLWKIMTLINLQSLRKFLFMLLDLYTYVSY